MTGPAADAGGPSPEGRGRMRMYILMRDSVPTGFAVLAAAHASLAAYLAYRDTPEMSAWLAGPFYKVVCRVSDEEFERAKAFADRVVLTESALGGQEVALAFKPREEWPKAFRFYRLYR
jgi:peptidyl-tRNA hydrolase